MHPRTRQKLDRMWLNTAVKVVIEADTRSDTVAALGALYGCLAPLVWKLKEDEGTKQTDASTPRTESRPE